MTGFISFVGAGPGAPDLITVRGYRALQNADVVLYDSLVELSALEEIKAELIFVGKTSGHHSLPQEEINALLSKLGLEGKRVVRFKGGDPSVFGRVGEEALHVSSQGIPFEIIPGVTSSIAGPMYAGIPVTHRGVADNFVVVTAHRNMDESDFSIPEYNSKTTLVLMMARGTVEIWREQLLERGYPKHHPIALVTSATSSKQQVVVTTVDDVAKDAVFYNVGMPTLAVAGNVVKLRKKLRWFKGEV